METIKLTQYKTIFKIASPVILSQASVTLCTLTDLCFLKNFGTVAIAAISIANVVIATFFNFLEGFRTGTSVLVSSFVKDRKSPCSILNTSFVLAIFLSMVVCLLSPYLSQFTYFCCSDEALLKMGYDYLKLWLMSVPFTLIFYILVGYCRGNHDTILPLYVTIEICLLNAIFDYFFISAFGVKGAAIATICSNAVCVVTLVLSLFKKNKSSFVINRCFYPFKTYLKLLVNIGFYTGFVNIALLVFVCFINRFGSSTLAAHQVAFQVFLLCYLPAIGFLVSASVIIPRLLSKESEDLIIPTACKIIRLSLLFALVIGILIFVFSAQISNYFIKDPSAQPLAIWLIKCMSFIQLVTCWNMALRGILTGLYETKFITKVGMFSGYVVFIPLMFIASHGGVKVCYIAFFIWCLCDALLFGYKFLTLNMKKYINGN